MIEAQLPIVGHNCLYDILFLYAAFEGDLPATLAEFKQSIAGATLPHYASPLVFCSVPRLPRLTSINTLASPFVRIFQCGSLKFLTPRC